MSPIDFVEFLEDLRLGLVSKEQQNTYINTVLADIGSIFFASQEARKPGLSAMSDEMQEDLLMFLKEQKPGKNIIASLLILWFVENNATNIVVTQKLIEDAYQKYGITGNVYQQLKDYGIKGRFPYIKEKEDGVYELTDDGREYIKPFISAESVENI